MAAPTIKRAKEALWRNAILAQRKSTQTIAAWCREHKRSVASFHWWKRQLALRDHKRFASVTVALPTDEPKQHKIPDFVLNLTGTGLLHIPHGFDADELRRLLVALKTPSC